MGRVVHGLRRPAAQRMPAEMCLPEILAEVDPGPSNFTPDHGAAAFYSWHSPIRASPEDVYSVAYAGKQPFLSVRQSRIRGRQRCLGEEEEA